MQARVSRPLSFMRCLLVLSILFLWKVLCTPVEVQASFVQGADGNYHVSLPYTAASTNITWSTAGFYFTKDSVDANTAGSSGCVVMRGGGMENSGNDYWVSKDTMESFVHSLYGGSSFGTFTIYAQSIISTSNRPGGDVTCYNVNTWMSAAAWRDQNVGNYTSHYNLAFTVSIPPPCVKYKYVVREYANDGDKATEKELTEFLPNSLKNKIKGQDNDINSRDNLSGFNQTRKIPKVYLRDKIVDKGGTESKDSDDITYRLIGYYVSGNGTKVKNKQQSFEMKTLNSVGFKGAFKPKETYGVKKDQRLDVLKGSRKKTSSLKQSAVLGKIEETKMLTSNDFFTDVTFVYAPVYDPVTIKIEGTYQLGSGSKVKNKKVSKALNKQFEDDATRFEVQKGSTLYLFDDDSINCPKNAKGENVSIKDFSKIQAVNTDANNSYYYLGGVKANALKSNGSVGASFSVGGFKAIKDKEKWSGNASSGSDTKKKMWKAAAKAKGYFKTSNSEINVTSNTASKYYNVITDVYQKDIDGTNLFPRMIKSTNLKLANVVSDVVFTFNYYNASPVIELQVLEVAKDAKNLSDYTYYLYSKKAYTSSDYSKAVDTTYDSDSKKYWKKKAKNLVQGQSIQRTYSGSKTFSNKNYTGYTGDSTNSKTNKFVRQESYYTTVSASGADSLLKTLEGNSGKAYSDSTKFAKKLHGLTKYSSDTSAGNGASLSVKTGIKHTSKKEWKNSGVTVIVSVYRTKQETPKVGRVCYLRDLNTVDSWVNTWTQFENSEVSLAFGTKDYTMGFEPYKTVNGKIYQFVRTATTTEFPVTSAAGVYGVPSGVLGDSELEYPFLLKSIDGNPTPTFTPTGGVIETSLSAPVVYEKNADKQVTQQTVFWGMYEEIPQPPPTTQANDDVTLHEFTSVTGYETGKMVNGHNDVQIDERMNCMIQNDSTMSSNREFEPELAIPSSEYLMTEAALPRYLVKGQWAKHNATVTCSMKASKYLLLETVSTDKYGNTVKSYEGTKLEHTSNINRSTSYYTLNYAYTYTPDTVTAENTTLKNNKVTMQATNNQCNNDTLGFTRVSEGGVYQSVSNPGNIYYGIEAFSVVTDSVLEDDDVDGRTEYNNTIADWNSAENQATLDEAASASIGNISSRNDCVNFSNGEGSTVTVLYSDNSEEADFGYQEENSAPLDVPDADDTAEGVFSSKNDSTTSTMQIKPEYPNGNNLSGSLAKYTVKQSLVGRDYNTALGGQVTLGADINPVNVFTPVYCNGSYSKTSARYTQAQNLKSNTNLVLDREFEITIATTGYNGEYQEEVASSVVSDGNGGFVAAPEGTTEWVKKTYPGYGQQDYSRYGITPSKKNGDSMKVAQVMFEFPVIPVYSNTGTQSENGVNYAYYEAHTWIDVASGATKFYLPSWAGEVTLSNTKFRSVALNAEANGMITAEQERVNNQVEVDPTSGVHSHPNYVAAMNEQVDVTGRIYGLSIIDVADYPTWESYFRDSKNLLTGNAYYSGKSNENEESRGISKKFTFPLINGSHPTLGGTGVIKPGYVTRFKLQTVGSYADKGDYVMIRPSFYWQSKSGTRQEKVDVYYDEQIAGKKQTYVKVGGTLDRTNKRYLSFDTSKMIAGSAKGYGASMDEISRTAKVLGYDTVREFQSESKATWTSDNIMIGKNMKTLVGNHHTVNLSNGNKLNLGEVEETLAGTKGVGTYDVTSSVQDWYCTYYLPSSLHILAKRSENPEKVVDPSAYNWMNGGYLIVKFDIYTVNDGVPNLWYNASDMNIYATNADGNPVRYESSELEGEIDTVVNHGLCNMWKVEGYNTSPRVSDDNYATEFQFKYGDFLVYDLGNDTPGGNGGSSGASGDYNSGGTH